MLMQAPGVKSAITTKWFVHHPQPCVSQTHYISLKVYDLWRHSHIGVGAHMVWWMDGWDHGRGHIKSIKIK